MGSRKSPASRPGRRRSDRSRHRDDDVVERGEAGKGRDRRSGPDPESIRAGVGLDAGRLEEPRQQQRLVLAVTPTAGEHRRWRSGEYHPSPSSTATYLMSRFTKSSRRSTRSSGLLDMPARIVRACSFDPRSTPSVGSGAGRRRGAPARPRCEHRPRRSAVPGAARSPCATPASHGVGRVTTIPSCLLRLPVLPSPAPGDSESPAEGRRSRSVPSGRGRRAVSRQSPSGTKGLRPHRVAERNCGGCS